MEATAAKHKAESDSAIERLRTDMFKQGRETLVIIMVAAGLIIASICVAATVLGIILSSPDTPPQQIILYPNQPSAAQAPATPATSGN